MHDTIDLTQASHRDAAAADYVLGTLTEENRVAFEALLSVSHETKALVREWQERLTVLHQGIDEVNPPKNVWQKIKKETNNSSRFYESLFFWRNLSFSLMLFIVVSITFFQDRIPVLSETDYIYVISNQAKAPGWIVNASMSADRVSIKAIQPDELPDGKVCELWLMVDGMEPISLGILPKYGTKEFVLTPEIKQKFETRPLVITVESAGGAPDGFNMGPVIQRGNWTKVNERLAL